MQSLSGKEIAQEMAVVLTLHQKTDRMTCWDVVSAGRYPYTGRLGLLSEADRQKVTEAMERVDILELRDTDFNAISDGQRQRVLLARAICQEPKIILLDEPTSFLDIRYKLELLSVLKRMAKEEQTAILLSLHELELAKKISDSVLCVKNGRIEKSGTPEEVLTEEYVCHLYDLDKADYQKYFGNTENTPRFAHYIQTGGKRLRCGYTTGTCAALAAAAATELLLKGTAPKTVRLVTPKGIPVEVEPQECSLENGVARCAVIKDAGDDIDVTANLPIFAEVKKRKETGIFIDGGEGVGRVTKAGLDQPVGAAAAINGEYTLPGVSQSVIITRMAGRTPVPEKEGLSRLAQHGTTMVLFLSTGLLKEVEQELMQGAYTIDTPAAIVYKATWEDEKVIFCTVGTLAERAAEAGIRKTALILIGDFGEASCRRSCEGQK